MKRSKQKSARVFCTDCGESLDNFFLDSGADDIKGIIQRMATCKVEGRFHGNFCSRLWIAGSESLPKLQKTVKSSPRKISALKASIAKRIRSEETRTTRLAKKKN